MIVSYLSSAKISFGILSSYDITGSAIFVNEADILKKTIIDEQEWSIENLNVIEFRNGDKIPRAQIEEWIRVLKERKLTWCYYNNDSENVEQFGKLHNIFALMDTWGLTPSGRHITIVEDWRKVVDHLNGQDIPSTKVQINQELKLTRTDSDSQPRWNLPNMGASDAINFSALPAGQRNYLGEFYYQGKFGFWWTSSTDIGDDDEGLGYYFGLRYDDPDLFLVSGNKKKGLSVRCIRS